jgi:hemolysin-activating ACP:hemolysin acyltransferase
MGQTGENGGSPAEPAPFKGFDRTHLGAAVSKLVAASVGDIAVVFSRSPAHKHYSLADIEWMILPPVFNGQFYVAEAASAESGFRAPIAIATWAFVSEEVDHRLCADSAPRVRLRPDEWKGGEIAWIVDLAGNPRGVAGALQWLKSGPFKDKDAKVSAPRGDGRIQVETLGALLSAQTKKTQTK